MRINKLSVNRQLDGTSQRYARNASSDCNCASCRSWLTIFPRVKKAVRDLANLMSPEFIQLTYRFSLTGYRDLPLAFDGRSIQKILVLRIAFRPTKAGEMIGTLS